ncbi:hypothetical protein EIZ48_28825 [Photobacterium alginatilyticum]|uniref:Uncharacterized protein n=1 Tax=Photobacterium alginatilyticum TaxID=1775171 RepID=A0ABW9YRZ1_9GAMM|nr:hypothetical protein [Photobacterium alginatilyticum]
MDYLIFLVPVVGGLVSFVHWYLHSPKLPTYDALGDLAGEKFFGFVRVDDEPHPVHFIVGEAQLGIIGGFPSFSLLLDIHELELTKKRYFFWYKVRIISHDFYTEHLFKELVVSARVARKLKRLSDGRLAY